MSNNSNLIRAKKEKNNEFYTQFVDIENELRHYKEHFRDKVVFCNCDDGYDSNFFKYFALNFNILGLKRLIAVSYAKSGRQVNAEFVTDSEKGYVIELESVTDINGDGAIDLEDVTMMLKQNPPRMLAGDGDFRSDECVEFLKQSDIVVSNPPFSLFREYIVQLMDYNKSFIIIGNKNAITYKECFMYIMQNKLWVGYTPMSKDLLFDVPEIYANELKEKGKVGSTYQIVDSKIKGRSQSIWFTNLTHSKRNEELILYRTYNESDYPKYDNYDAIEVSKTADIPQDYEGVMCVPITFLDKYNPSQFNVIGCTCSFGRPAGWADNINMNPTINGKSKYVRVLICRNKGISIV